MPMIGWWRPRRCLSVRLSIAADVAEKHDATSGLIALWRSRGPAATTYTSFAPATMSSVQILARHLSRARPTSTGVSSRLFSTSRALRNETAPNLGTVTPKKPVGAFRGGYVHTFHTPGRD